MRCQCVKADNPINKHQLEHRLYFDKLLILSLCVYNPSTGCWYCVAEQIHKQTKKKLFIEQLKVKIKSKQRTENEALKHLD